MPAFAWFESNVSAAPAEFGILFLVHVNVEMQVAVAFLGIPKKE